MRPNRDTRIFMDLELNSLWATCYRGQVASALVNFDGIITVPARNGVPIGMPHCEDMQNVNRNERCPFCIHSEKNTINFAARLGVKTENQLIYTLKRPCLGCSNDIVQAGIVAVYYRWDYDTDNQKDYVMSMFADNGIIIKQFDMTMEEITFSSMLQEWKTTWITQ